MNWVICLTACMLCVFLFVGLLLMIVLIGEELVKALG